MALARPVRAFYSYSHHNRKEQARLETFLAPMIRRKEIQTWGDTAIRAGKDWRAELDSQLAVAEIFFLLVTADYLGSEECWKELRVGLDRSEEGNARVIPVITRPCGWQTVPEIQRWQVLPEGGKPVIRKGSQPDEEWQDVAAGIQKVVSEMLTSVPASPSQGADTLGYSWTPFLCDRSEEDETFRKALGAHPEGSPFVCILHGDAQQAHKEFVKRLERSAISEVLGLDSRQPVHRLPSDLLWLGLNTNGSADEIFGPELADILDPPPESAAKDHLAAAVARRRGATVVYSVVSARDWHQSGPRLLERFLEFWRDWPRLAPGQHLVVFLALLYLESHIQGANTSMAAALKPYENSGNPDSGNPKVIALPSIRQEHVEEWLRDPRIQRICDTARLGRHIPLIFGSNEPRGRSQGGAGELPMEPLAGILEGLLQRYRI
jgi:hypothetical protein